MPGLMPGILWNLEVNMTDTPQFLSERLISEGEKSIAFFKEIRLDQYSQVIYTEGSHWTVHQVIAHFVTSEHSLCRLVENIACGGPGTPEDFNIDSYNERKVLELASMSVDEMLERFRLNRQMTAALVAGLQLSDLEKQGRHPFLGVAPLTEIIKIIYRHNQIHQREVRKALSIAG